MEVFRKIQRVTILTIPVKVGFLESLEDERLFVVSMSGVRVVLESLFPRWLEF